MYVNNVMEKLGDDMEISIYDRAYRRNKSFIEDTILLIKSIKLNLPIFTITPERVGSSIEKFLGLKDINFTKYPKFSSQYILSSDDKEKIYYLFSKEIISFFENNDIAYVESGLDYIFFTERKVNPEKRESLLTKYLSVIQLFINDEIN